MNHNHKKKKKNLIQEINKNCTNWDFKKNCHKELIKPIN